MNKSVDIWKPNLKTYLSDFMSQERAKLALPFLEEGQRLTILMMNTLCLSLVIATGTCLVSRCVEKCFEHVCFSRGMLIVCSCYGGGYHVSISSIVYLCPYFFHKRNVLSGVFNVSISFHPHEWNHDRAVGGIPTDFFTSKVSMFNPSWSVWSCYYLLDIFNCYCIPK